MRKRKPYRCTDRWGIINPYGEVWSPETFATHREAFEHLKRFWRSNPRMAEGYSFEQVRVTVSRIKPA